MEPSYATLHIAAPSQCCLSWQTLELLVVHFGDVQYAPLCLCHFNKRRHQCASFRALLQCVKKKHDRIVCKLQRASRCCHPTCGSINGGSSVLRRMQTAGEVSKHAAWPLQKNSSNRSLSAVWSVSSTRGERATQQPEFGDKFTVLDLSLLL